jgi:glucose-1-phosphate thymidylyltransferase
MSEVWGIIPGAGNATRVRPLAISKELLPLGRDGDVPAAERPRPVSEYLLERMEQAGARRICFVISPEKSDIVAHFGGRYRSLEVAYAVQDRPAGLCDAIFRALPLIPHDATVLVGLPDTVWFPTDALAGLPNERLTFLLFPVDKPWLYEAVDVDRGGRVRDIQIQALQPRSNWVWGAFKLPAQTLHELHALWIARGQRDERVGTLINAWIAGGGETHGVRAGESFVDVSIVHGYREAKRLLDQRAQARARQPMKLSPQLMSMG